MRSGWLWTLLALLLLAAGAYAGYVYLQPQPLAAGLLYGSGQIEATEVTVSAEVTGRVIETSLSEGARVEQGALLARIDDADLRASLAQAEATRIATGRERTRLEQELEAARHHLNTSGQDLARYRDLYARGATPQQRLDQATNTFAEAQGRVSALQEAVAEAASREEAAGQQAELLRLRLGRVAVRSPISGTVLVRAIEAGELASPGRAVAVLADLTRIELRIFVPERDIGRISLGAPARVRISAFPDRLFPARVARVDQRAQFTPRDVHMPEERTRLVFGVTLAVENPDGLLKPGMPADAWILWDPNAAWPARLVVPE